MLQKAPYSTNFFTWINPFIARLFKTNINTNESTEEHSALYRRLLIGSSIGPLSLRWRVDGITPDAICKHVLTFCRALIMIDILRIAETVWEAWFKLLRFVLRRKMFFKNHTEVVINNTKQTNNLSAIVGDVYWRLNIQYINLNWSFRIISLLERSLTFENRLVLWLKISCWKYLVANRGQ